MPHYFRGTLGKIFDLTNLGHSNGKRTSDQPDSQRESGCAHRKWGDFSRKEEVSDSKAVNRSWR